MRRLAFFILIACSSFTLGIFVSSFWLRISGSRSSSSDNTPVSSLTKQPVYATEFPSEEFDLPSEISFERIYDGCDGCGDRKVVFQRVASKRFEEATVTETDLDSKTERQGKLNPYYFNNLLRLIEEQGYFGMSNQYAMGWVDSAMVRVGVRIGERHKTIETTNEGDVPIELWGIYYAIEGAWAHVDWRTSPVSPQSNKRSQRTRR
jgi:hypothetical protein